jgi:hypothetical protein
MNPPRNPIGRTPAPINGVEEAVEEPALHEASKQPDAEPNEARDDHEHGGSDPRGVHDA